MCALILNDFTIGVENEVVFFISRYFFSNRTQANKLLGECILYVSLKVSLTGSTPSQPTKQTKSGTDLAT